jgi:large subunit ribosomal protein L13
MHLPATEQDSGMVAMKTTVSVQSKDADRMWWVVDLEGETLGRAAARIAHVLRGKHKPCYTPHNDTGDFVIVVNAGKARLTGRKELQKQYHRHTGYMGGIRTLTAEKLREKHPNRLIETAVRGMLPKTPLGRRMLRKLKVYSGPAHPHQAQQPQPLKLETT